MRKETVIICVLVGLVLGMGTLLYRTEPVAATEVTGRVENPAAARWEGRVVWSDSPIDETAIVNYTAVLTSEAAEFARIRGDMPKLFLADDDGGRVVVVTYNVPDPNRLHLTAIAGLWRTWYRELIAWDDASTEELIPVDLDVRIYAGQ